MAIRIEIRGYLRGPVRLGQPERLLTGPQAISESTRAPFWAGRAKGLSHQVGSVVGG